jgi:AraC-like DNA-binding protein
MLTDRDRQVLPESMLRLVEAVFYNSSPPVRDEQADKTRQFERLRQAIRDHARDPELSCERLCQVLSVSRSTLYGLTRMAGTSIERMIIDERLAQSASCLHDPAWQGYSITDIAFAQGFRDLSHFSRRFKERFGLSPMQYRAARTDS